MKNIEYNLFFVNNKQIFTDSIVLILLIAVTSVVLVHFEVSELVYTYTRAHEEYELDEIILLLAFSSFYMSIFTIKRFFELKQLLLNANTDPLLGIINRRKGDEYILNEINRIKKFNNYSSSIILCDIDKFKYINDTHGHNYGDYALKEICKFIDNEIRNNDLFIRWGGEEFIIICKETNLEEAVKLAQRCRVKIQNHPFNNNVRITASFGVIQLNHSQNLTEQILNVDKKLYESKKNGRNQVRK